MKYSKKKIINTLFLISPLIWGFGFFVKGFVPSPSIAFSFMMLGFLCIIGFYLVDLLYKKRFTVKVNRNYWLFFFFFLSIVIARYIGYDKGVPNEDKFARFLTLSIQVIVPFHAALIYNIYNAEDEDFDYAWQIFIALFILMAINILGWAAGVQNKGHNIEGRAAMPFIGGLYTGGNMVCIAIIMTIMYLPRFSFKKQPVVYGALVAFLLLNFLILFLVNSRLTILVFLLVMGLYFTRSGFVLLPLVIGAWMMQPILLSFSYFIAEVLVSIPGLDVILQRVDVDDIADFNGRAYLWRPALDWILYEQDGLLFGWGFNGNHWLDLFPEIQWNTEGIKPHLHSSTYEWVICQGMVGLIMVAVIMYKVLKHYQIHYVNEGPEKPLYFVMLFMLFIMQVDVFAYHTSYGFVVLSIFWARICIKDEYKMKWLEKRKNQKSGFGNDQETGDKIKEGVFIAPEGPINGIGSMFTPQPKKVALPQPEQSASHDQPQANVEDNPTERTD